MSSLTVLKRRNEFNEYKTKGQKAPKHSICKWFTIYLSRTTVTLPLVGVDHALSAEGHEKGHENLTVTKTDELNARRMAIYSMIEATSDISIPQIAKRLEITDKQARSDIDYLKKSGYIRHEGPAKGGKWIVSKAYNPD